MTVHFHELFHRGLTLSKEKGLCLKKRERLQKEKFFILKGYSSGSTKDDAFKKSFQKALVFFQRPAAIMPCQNFFF